MTHLHCISYARGRHVKGVGLHGCRLSPFFVNRWWTLYIGQRPIEFHGLHGCKSTLCLVLMVWARSRDNVQKSQAVSKSVHVKPGKNLIFLKSSKNNKIAIMVLGSLENSLDIR